MGDFRISGKNVITQSGTDEPVLASNVTLGTGIVKPGNISDAATSTLSCTTASSTTVTTADSSSLSLGMAVTGTGIPANAYIVTIPNATSFTIPSAATDSATKTLTFRTGVTSGKLNFEGTIDNTTFLRSDKTWATAGSPSITDGGNATAITIDSSEDVTFEKRAIIPSLKPKSNQNLTGTYADHEMIMGDKFTLTGNLTINDNLVLASLSGSGQDIIIEDDGNGRTITTAGKVISCTTTNTDATVTTADTSDLRAGTGVTGTGIPSGATIASVTNATTFELSAAATASGTVNLTFDTAIFEAGEFLGTAGLPSLNDLTGTIQPAVVFPAGMPLQVKQLQSNEMFVNGDNSTSFTRFDATYVGGAYPVHPGFKTTITNCKTGSSLLINVSLSVGIDGDHGVASFRLYDITNSQVIGTEGPSGLFGSYIAGDSSDGREYIVNVSYSILYTPVSFSSGNCEIELYARTGGDAASGAEGNRSDTARIIFLNRAAGTDQYKHSSSMLITEIAG